MKKRNIFWGIFFILAAVFLLVSNLGIVPDIGAATVLATAFSLWLFIDGLRYLPFYSITFAIAFFYIIFDEPLHIDVISPWTALTAALLSGIGLSLLFGWKKKRYFSVDMEYDWNNKKNNEHCSGKSIHCENSFGSVKRYINFDDFCMARIDNNFGSIKVYFDNSIIQGDSAYVDIDNNFGETVLYIPKEWKVQTNLSRSFGSVEEFGSSIGTSNATLYIQGDTSFGHIAIHYV